MTKLVNDISVYQPASYSYVKNLYNHGSRGITVKLTEGNWYLNQRAGTQVYNAMRVFGSVSVYHYLDNYSSAYAQAQYFCNWMKAFHLDSLTVWALDVEDPSLPFYCNLKINVFINYMKAHGYPTGKVVYGSASWFDKGRINPSYINTDKIWVAAYGASEPGVANTSVWQYTDNFCGLGTDGSYDFNGTFTDAPSEPAPKPKHKHLVLHKSKPKAKPKPAVPKYWHKPGKYEVVTSVNVYNDLSFKKNDNVHLDKGSTFTATQVFTIGEATRLKTDAGYISGNSDFVRPLK